MKGVKFRVADNSRFSIKDSNRNLKDVIPSNTLFAAIINNVNLIYGEDKATEVVEQFKNDKFSISSMFIGLDFYDIYTERIENTIYFVPKPEAIIESIDIDENELEENIIKRKEAKKIKMVSLNALKEIGRTWSNERSMFNYNFFDLTNIGSELACTEEEISFIKNNNIKDLSFVNNIVNPHVKVNLITSKSENFFFYDEKVYNHQYIGSYRIEPFLYFMYLGDLIMEIKSAINLMVDEGIGGKRSIGMGTFVSNEYVDIDIINNINSNIFMNLSSYIPLKKELDSFLGYKIEKTNGYIYDKGGLPFRKKSIGVIQEGAIVSQKVEGQLLDVTPTEIELSHKIYYNGKSFNIGIGGDIYE